MRVRHEKANIVLIKDENRTRRKAKGKAKAYDVESAEEDDEEVEDEEVRGEEDEAAVEDGTGCVWETYSVVDTRPLLQGVLDEASTVIIVLPPLPKGSNVATAPAEEGSLASSHHLDPHSERPSNRRHQDSAPLLMSSFILPSCRSLLLGSDEAGASWPPPNSKGEQVPNGELYAAAERNGTPAAPMLEVVLLTRPLEQLEPSPSWRDEMCEVGLTLFTLRRLRFFSGSWVVLGSAASKRERLARVYGLPPVHSKPEKWVDERVYMSPILAHNLGITQGSLVAIREHRAGWTEARAMHIALVRSPSSSLRADYSVPLRRYFRSPRLLSLGDLIPVVLPSPRYPFVRDFFQDGQGTEEGDQDDDEEDEEDEEQDETGQQENRDCQGGDLVYFKVTRALPESSSTLFFCVSREETMLVQEGVVNAALPPNAPMYLQPGKDKHAEALRGEGWAEVEDVMRACLEGPAAGMQIGCSILVHGPPANGKLDLARYLSAKLGIHLVVVDLFALLLDGVGPEVVPGLQKAFREAWACHPSLLLIRSLHALRSSSPSPTDAAGSVGKELVALANEYCDARGGKVALLGTADRIDDVPSMLRAAFRHEIQLPTPGTEMRLSQLSHLFARTPLAPDVEMADVARKTASFVARDLRLLHSHASATALSRVLRATQREVPLSAEIRQQHEEAIAVAGVVVTTGDIERGIAKVTSHRASSIAAPNIPNVQWEDVGGLAHVKRAILDTIQLPLSRPDLFAGELRKRSGLLLYGPPGTGKTLVAKAVATECSLNFMSVKGPELINMYIGESEKNVRDTFQRARDARPCVIFFDELDSLAPARGAGADSGGVMDRIVSQLLTELDGVHKSSDVFVIGATNRPDLLEPALLRPGRFDRLLYLGVPDDRAQQLHIVKALTRKFNMSSSVRLEQVVQAAPLNLTGADFYALCSEALQAAIREQIISLSSLSATAGSCSSAVSLAKGPVLVEQHHFMEALTAITPSVSPTELEQYRQLQQTYAQSQSSHGRPGLLG